MQDKYVLSNTSTRPRKSSASTLVAKGKPENKTSSHEYTSASIGWILRVGVSVSAAMMLIGFFLLLLDPKGLSARAFTYPHTPADVWMGLFTLHPQAVMMLGLILLVATPVFSVTASVVTFALERDRLYVMIALIVLSILMTSLLFGKGIG
ncbi:MAG: hypothetical protein NVS4B12_09310 [Ktedonobacteraceae bacterium]